MPRPQNQNTYSRIEIPPSHFADLEQVRRQARSRSSSGGVTALIRWATTNPDAIAEFGRWCDAQAAQDAK